MSVDLVFKGWILFDPGPQFKTDIILILVQSVDADENSQG